MGLFDKVMARVNGIASGDSNTLKPEWTTDRVITLKGTPDNLAELKDEVDVTDPGSVAAYWAYSVMCLSADYDTAIEMMKYLFADIEPYAKGFTEGGKSGKAGFDPYFKERLRDDKCSTYLSAYFNGEKNGSGFTPDQPLNISLHYNAGNTQSINEQTFEQLGRLNIVYWIKSAFMGDYKLNITLSRFEGTDRWYVTNGTASSGMFYGIN
jgi:hypothetical protein